MTARVIFLFTIIILAVTERSEAQLRRGRDHDDLPRLSFGFDLKAGTVKRTFTFVPLSEGYNNALNLKTGNLKFNDGKALGFAIPVNYYLNRSRSIGIGSGIMFFKQDGSLSLDNFHVEYESTDFQGSHFRQIVSSSQTLNEIVKTATVSIPLLLVYKKEIRQDLIFSIDAGILYTVLCQNAYTADAAFDYEAVYKYTGSGSKPNPVFDNAAVPDSHDWIITAKQYRQCR